MIRSFTALYSKNESGYKGQLIEWQEVEATGNDIQDCQKNLRDALHLKIDELSVRGEDIPQSGSLVERISVQIDKRRNNGVSQFENHNNER